ncbi:MAG: hypothetical protein LBP40_04960 [Campylobacteraceae bacterium]|nr:hypothetical protein [Campylobacteraceae bacterium]
MQKKISLTKYEIKYTKQIKKDCKLLHKQGKNAYFDKFIDTLTNDERLRLTVKTAN